MSDLVESIKNSGLIAKISRYAPSIADALGSPIAGMVLSLVSAAFGVSSNPVDVTSAIQSDPDAMLKLKALEAAHAEELAKLVLQNYIVQTKDIQDAREKGKDYLVFLKHMAYLVTIGFFGAMAILLLPISIDPSERQIFSMLVGMLVTKWATIVDFYYGSSQKDEIYSRT